MRFGVLVGEGEKRVGERVEAFDGDEGSEGGGRHIGFGPAERVVGLRRGGKYI